MGFSLLQALGGLLGVDKAQPGFLDSGDIELRNTGVPMAVTDPALQPQKVTQVYTHIEK